MATRTGTAPPSLGGDRRPDVGYDAAGHVAPRPGRAKESNVIIRPETGADAEAISAVTIAAFADCPYSRQTEPFIIKALRAARALTLSLVAEIDGTVVGHIAFSPVTITDGSAEWYGVGPLSVSPPRQRRGIGTALVREALSRMKACGAQGCVLMGDPKYYQRFGFRNLPELVLAGVPQGFFQALPLGASTPRGVVTFHPAFSAQS